MRLDDASLLMGNFCQGVAEEPYMVEADVSDDREVGRDDIGAVESSAKAHLDDGYIDLLLSDVEDCHGRGEFKDRGAQVP